jgi:hypothetical protein
MRACNGVHHQGDGSSGAGGTAEERHRKEEPREQLQQETLKRMFQDMLESDPVAPARELAANPCAETSSPKVPRVS